MADGLSTLIGRIQSEVPELTARQHEAWGGSTPEARLLIRTSIAETLSPLSADEKIRLLDLKVRPCLHSHDVSVSHTLATGAWVAVPRPLQIGFDVETVARITPRLLERVCEASELAVAPDPIFLWAAKEACFKSLPSQNQPPVMSALRLTAWAPAGPLLFTFSASVPGRGWVSTDGIHVFAAFVSREANHTCG